MAYPPAVPPNTRTDQTPQTTNHPGDHNQISGALTDIINELGADPSSSSYTDVTARLAAMQSTLTTVNNKQLHLSLGWDFASIGSKTGTGIYDILSEHQGETFTYPVQIFIDAQITFGFGTKANGVQVSGDIFRFLDNATMNNYPGPFLAAQGAWGQFSMKWSYSVAAGQQWGFKVRGNIQDLGGAGGNCYLQSAALWSILPGA